MKKHRLLFYCLWLGLTLLQAGLTELQDDEAYYWVFSKFPDWGYFDHPPLLALLIKAGYAIFPNELGVRFFPLLLNLLSLPLIEKLTGRKNPLLFYTILLSIAVLQMGGFLAVPDSPLIFFTALFFLRFKAFLEQDSWKNTLLLALSIALLCYTKYQALPVVLFAFVPHLYLLLKKRIYITVIIVLLLYLPHLYWQWDHHWMSFRYHLLESNVSAWKFSYTLGYIGGQFLLAGPVAGILLIPAAFLYKPRTKIERSLKATMIGFYVLFFLASFRGEVEMNWTAPALVPLIILAHGFISERPRFFSLLFRLLPLTLLLVLFARVIMIVDIIPVNSLQKRFHAWKHWPDEMKKRTGGLPVVFSNSYQRASKYWFYTGQVTLSQNHVMDHRNNYDFWPVEARLLGRPVYYLDIYDLYRFPDSLKTPLGYIGYRFDSSCNSLSGIQFIPDQKRYSIKPGENLIISGTVEMQAAYKTYLRGKNLPAASVMLFIFRDRRIEKTIALPLNLNDCLTMKFMARQDPGLPAGNYSFIISIVSPGYNPTHNSERIGLRVVNNTR